MIVIKIILILILTVTLVGMIMYTFPRVRIDGVSMCPTYQDGSILIATRLFNPRRLKIGQVYVFIRVDDELEEHIVIKRLTKVYKINGTILCYFEGDNQAESYDSRYYGFINAEQIIAKVLWQIKE